MTEFKKAEQEIERLLGKLPGRPKRRGHIRLSFSKSGDISRSGSFKYGRFRANKEMDIHDALATTCKNDWDYLRLFTDLFEASKSEPHGPIYSAEISIENKIFSFQYWWMNDPELTPTTVRRTERGDIPSFMFIKHFNKQLLDLVDDDQVFYCLEDVIYTSIEKNIAPHTDLIDYYAVYDWITDCLNGSWDQYFGRVTDGWSTGEFSRKEMYKAVVRALSKLDAPKALHLFEEAIGIYANISSYVEEARADMNIVKQPEQDEYDIFGRFSDIHEYVQFEIVQMIRGKIAEYEIDFRKS